jgi:RHS repeat-associated protein
LNQYSQRTVPGGFDVLGIANVGAVIQVNSSTNGVYRRGEYFRKELSVNNNVAVWQGVTNTATLGQDQNTETGNVFVPPTPETFAHDADGNLTNDGRWAYVWDAENRLVRMVSRTNTPTNSWRALNFSYDYQGRRISKTVSNWNGVAWTIVLSNKFLYDGWNLLAELNATNNNRIRTYVWGLDLDGSMQGAGGVGGLLKISNLQSPIGDHFPAYDGNGNLTALFDALDGSVVANYEYGPFGELIRANGPMAKLNPFRFSSKYTDDESDLLYYGYRYLSSATGRWLSRDPITESGGVNLSGFVDNAPIGIVDSFGLCNAGCRCKKVQIEPGIPIAGSTEPIGPNTDPPPKDPRTTQRISLGVKTFYTIEIEGDDKSQCKCQYTDKGKITGNIKFKFKNGQTAERPVDDDFDPVKNPKKDVHIVEDCKSGTDRPGVALDMGPMGGSMTFTLKYDLTVTLTCVGSDNVTKSSAAHFGATYGATYSWPDQK